MSQEVINIGSAPNDGTGDPLRTAFTKTNANFAELYGSLFDPSAPGAIGNVTPGPASFTDLTAGGTVSLGTVSVSAFDSSALSKIFSAAGITTFDGFLTFLGASSFNGTLTPPNSLNILAGLIQPGSS